MEMLGELVLAILDLVIDLAWANWPRRENEKDGKS
jgi:hypothetical protein